MKARYFAVLLAGIIFVQTVWAEDKSRSGTVSGTVLDVGTGMPVAGAQIYLLNTKVCRLGGAKMTVRTLQGEFLLPHFQSAAVRGSADAAGAFRMAGVPAPQPFKSYTVFVRAAGYADFVIYNAAVYPGASKTLRIDCRLARGAHLAAWYEGSAQEAPISYCSEKE
jgi:hypothetical protein